ncbi:GNAT family N-acetyltransferase [Bacillus sp. Marseille-Q1617]|uniref:GNAT family N-acetyltransferase n=1 Tax=Bacillus sp. Marseille-Q1617 TaxID=2736887 RepID=UPI001589CD15|nr:GNAT family N-acetyltransferase [Bacillus sp. Marseille-Q1617]
MGTVRLTQYSEKYRSQLSGFHLPEEQLEFTSLPLEKIHNPHISDNTAHVLIVEDEEPVGYFALEDGEKLHKYSENQQARLLTSFSIDSAQQGKGLAKKGLSLLPVFVQDQLPGIDEVVLGVNKRNTAAISLYLKTGFVDEGEIYVGPKGPQHVLHLRV